MNPTPPSILIEDTKRHRQSACVLCAVLIVAAIVALPSSSAIAAPAKKKPPAKGTPATSSGPPSDRCAAVNAAYETAKKAYDDAYGCEAWVRRGTYKDDGKLMTYADCPGNSEALKSAATAAASAKSDCERQAQCTTILAAKPTKPTCVYDGTPGRFRCGGSVPLRSAGRGGKSARPAMCGEFYVDGITLPGEAAALAHPSTTCGYLRQLEQGLMVTNDREPLRPVHPENYDCDKDPEGCVALQQCVKDALWAVRDDDIKICACEAGFDPGRLPQASEECARQEPRSKDVDRRAQQQVLGALLDTEKRQQQLQCEPWTPERQPQRRSSQ